MTMQLTLGELAERLQLEVQGQAQLPLRGVCALTPGQPDCLGFLADRKQARHLHSSLAAAVILDAQSAECYSGNALIAANPHVAFARAAALFETRHEPEPGVHPSAWVHPEAVLGEGVRIAAMCSVDKGVHIGARSSLGPGCSIGAEVVLGADAKLAARVVVYAGVRIGAHCHIEAGAVIGARGFGLAWDTDHWLEVPQMGRVIIADHVEIGANTCIDRGALEDTVIGTGVKIDNLVQIGHNNRIDEHAAIAGCTGIAGSSHIGARCRIGGGVGIADHLEIPADSAVTGFSMVAKSLPKADLYASQVPVMPAAEWRKQLARIRQLDRLARRVAELEKRL